MPANGRWPYADPRWAIARSATLARDGYRCTICGVPRGQGVLIDVDHIIGWDERPDLAFDLTNLRCLCRLHHNRKTHGGAAHAGRSRRRRIRRTSRRW